MIKKIVAVGNNEKKKKNKNKLSVRLITSYIDTNVKYC